MKVQPSTPMASPDVAGDREDFSEPARFKDAGPAIRKMNDSWKTVDQASSLRSLSQSLPRIERTTTTRLNPNAVSETKARATVPNRLYGLSYTLPGIGNGLTSLTFPMRIDQAQQRVGDDDAGNYYAMQLDVNDLNGKHLGTAYTGLQPRQDGKALMTFSGFNQHFSAPDGKSGADGGPGASNSALIDFQFGHKYALTIERDPNHHSLLKAFVQDVTDPARPGPRQHVKNLQLDQDVLLAPNSGGGFIEHYGKSISKSSQIAPTRGTFYAPFGTTALGKTIHGSLTPGDLSGRFSQSTTGERTIVKTAGRISEVSVSVRGAK